MIIMILMMIMVMINIDNNDNNENYDNNDYGMDNYIYFLWYSTLPKGNLEMKNLYFKTNSFNTPKGIKSSFKITASPLNSKNC